MTFAFTEGILMLLGIYLIGLSLNLTPCVYPMISVTLSLFGTQKEISRRVAFGKAVVYVLGIATMYSVLGVAAAMTGQFFGAYLQNPWVLTMIAVLLLFLALSLFGAYTFQMPSWLLQKVGGGKKASLLGIYASGLFVGIFAAPCVGPPIIALLTYVGTRGDPFFGFWLFFVMSLGLGTPYLIFGTFSGLLAKLPRSGDWMLWVERLFGVVLLSLAFFYFLLAWFPDYLMGWLPVSLIAGGLYLGFFEQSGAKLNFFPLIKKAAGVLAILAGFLLPLSQSGPAVAWEVLTEEKLIEAQESRQPVIIDFYADWCIPCHELDQFTYTDAKVIQALKPFRKFKADLTQPEAPEELAMIEKFDVIGVPTILFLDRDGDEIIPARITGFVPPKAFLANMASEAFQRQMEPLDKS